MINRPRFKEHFQVEVIEPHNVFLLTEDNQWLLQGNLYARLAPLLSNGHNFTVNQLASHLKEEFSQIEVFLAISQLEKKGYITESDNNVAPTTASFWHSLGVTSQQAVKRLASTKVNVTSVGSASASPLIAALNDNDVCIAPDAHLRVVVVDDYLQAELETINSEALASGQAWMPVRLQGMAAWIGPIFQPNEGACWACMANRIRINRQLEAYVLRQVKRSDPLLTNLASTPATLETGANLAATQIQRWIVTRHNPLLNDQLLTYHFHPTRLQKHKVTRRPQCPVCGDPDAFGQPKKVFLQSQPLLAGSTRSLRPEETFAKYEHHISSITGIVTWLADTSGPTDGMMHNYSSGHSFAIARDTLDYLRDLLKGRTGGKGFTQIQAKTSAVCEALERYTGVYRADEPFIRSTYAKLGEKALHVNDIMNFSEHQYAIRDEWNENLKATRFNVVPNPFDEQLEIDWTPIWSLNKQRFHYLPTAFCYYGHHESVEHFFCLCDSNGIAAGNSTEEAIRSGFMELVERDGLAMWWYNRIQRQGVDLDSFNIPYLNNLQQWYRDKLKRELWAIDVTTDLNIPAFVVLSRRFDRQPEDIIFGSSADLDPAKALMGAVMECNQFLPAIMRASEDGNTNYIVHDPAAVAWWTTATIATEPYLLPDPDQPAKKLSDYPVLHSNDIKTDIEKCVDIAAGLGMETFVLDQTRPDIGLSVCKVVVPGMRHFWRRLGKGRLYDVPVKLGWMQEPLSEQELNPVSIFY